MCALLPLGNGGVGEVTLEVPLDDSDPHDPAHELARRAVRLAGARRKAAAELWERRGDLQCVVLLEECTPTLVVDAEHCLVVGRAIADATETPDLDRLFGDRGPALIILSGYSDGLSDAVRAAANHVTPFLGRVTVRGGLPATSQATVVAALEQAGLCSVPGLDGSVSGVVGAGECLTLPSRVHKTYVVSLAQELDGRWPSFLEAHRGEWAAPLPPEPERFDAADGRRHAALTPAMRKLFRIDKSGTPQGNPFEDHGWRPGVLGCALSHFEIWREMVRSLALPTDAYLVMEDDARALPGFGALWQREHDSPAVLLDPRWDIWFLGFLDDQPVYETLPVWPGVEAFSRQPRSHGGGTFAYLLRRRGAQRLLDLAASSGIGQAVDWFMIEAFTSRSAVVAYKCAPLVVGPRTDVDSSTTASYPWTLDHACPPQTPSAEAKAEAGSLGGGITLSADVPALAPRDARVGFSAQFASDSELADFKARHRCFQVCYSLDRPVGSSPEQALGCVRLFDPAERFLPLELLEPGSEHELHVAGFSSLLPAPVPGEPVRFRVHPTWLELDAALDAPNRTLSATVRAWDVSLAAFLGKHGTTSVCLGLACVALRSLPARLPWAASDATRLVVRTLDGLEVASASVPGSGNPGGFTVVAISVEVDASESL